MVDPDTIRVDPEIAALIPPPAMNEVALLEVSLRQEGLRDPLVIWQETGILLDGHNRLTLCRKLGIDVRAVYRSFPDRQAATAYVLSLQLARRNLSAEAASYLRGKRYLEEKKADGGARSEAGGHFVQAKTSVKLAKEFQVGEKTIRRDAQFAFAVDDIVRHCGEKARLILLSRDFGLRRSQILRLARRKPAEQRKFLEHLQKTGKPPKQKPDNKPRSVTLPTDPEAFVDVLLRRLAPEDASRIARILSRRIKSKQ